MSQPPLLLLEQVCDYKAYFERHYCRSVIMTADDIRVYFKPQKFGHAFYENSQRTRGPKDEFSRTRAERMPWIKATLENPEAQLYEGWNKHSRRYEENRRVSVVFEEFAVVIELSLSLDAQIKGNFVTCYLAERSIEKIRSSPRWDRGKCMNYLKRVKVGR